MLYSKLTCQILYTEETKTCEKNMSLASTVDSSSSCVILQFFRIKGVKLQRGLFLDLLFCAKYVFMEGPRHLFRQVLRRLSKTILVFFLWMFFFVAIC